VVESDIEAFSRAWRGAWRARDRDPTPEVIAQAFKALAPYPLALVLRALELHTVDTARGHFVPQPSDVVRQVQAIDGHPGAQEAWALVLPAIDERETVVMTREMAAALELARPLLLAGDEVAARMTFIEHYQRRLHNARRLGRSAHWQLSLGYDPERRQVAIERAVATGLLPRESVAHLLRAEVTPEGRAIAGLLTGTTTPAAALSPDFQARLQQLREGIQKGCRGDLAAAADALAAKVKGNTTSPP